MGCDEDKAVADVGTSLYPLEFILAGAKVEACFTETVVFFYRYYP